MPDEAQGATDLRLECLRLAQEGESANSVWPQAEKVITRARLYLDFALGARDAEVIDAAREFARKIAQP